MRRDAADLRTRPRDDRWSAAEYACHVRDVFRIFDQRLVLMLEADDPTFPSWDQDATAVAERYQEQDPGAVAGQLAEAAGRLAPWAGGGLRLRAGPRRSAPARR